MGYITINDKASEALAKLSKQRKKEENYCKSKQDVASEAILILANKELKEVIK